MILPFPEQILNDPSRCNPAPENMSHGNKSAIYKSLYTSMYIAAHTHTHRDENKENAVNGRIFEQTGSTSRQWSTMQKSKRMKGKSTRGFGRISMKNCLIWKQDEEICVKEIIFIKYVYNVYNVYIIVCNVYIIIWSWRKIWNDTYRVVGTS